MRTPGYFNLKVRPELPCSGRKRKKLLLLNLGLIGIFIFFTSQGILRLISEFCIQRNYNPRIFEDYGGGISTEDAPVPRILHQIFFNISNNRIEFWKKYQTYRDSWKNLNPDYEYVLWNKSMVIKLIEEHYPDVLPMFKKYEGKFHIQSDIARYVVIHQCGGVYIDIDIKCKGSIKQLYDHMGSKTIALNFTYNPLIGMANDFFVASKQHKFLQHVIDGLPDADVTYFTPYVNVLLKIGPLFFLGRYLNYPYKKEIYTIPVDLINSLTDRSNFGRSWHEADGIMISFVWDHFGRYIFFVPMIIVLVVKIKIVKVVKIFRGRSGLVMDYEKSDIHTA